MQIPDGRRVVRLHRLWDRGEVPFEETENGIAFDLGELGEYEIVSAELAP